MRQRLTKEQLEQQHELNRRCHVLVEAAQCLQTRAMMVEQLERQRHYSSVGLTREADGVAFERADRIRRVAAFLASVKLRDLIRDSNELMELLLGDPGPSCNGTDFTEPRLPTQRTGWRPIEERMGL